MNQFEQDFEVFWQTVLKPSMEPGPAADCAKAKRLLFKVFVTGAAVMNEKVGAMGRSDQSLAEGYASFQLIQQDLEELLAEFGLKLKAEPMVVNRN